MEVLYGKYEHADMVRKLSWRAVLVQQTQLVKSKSNNQ